MWCNHCQLDVPVVARSERGPVFCPSCRGKLSNSLPGKWQPSPADTGIELEAFDRQEAGNRLSPPRSLEVEEQTRQRLRQIRRQLQSSPHGRQVAPPIAPPAAWMAEPPEAELHAITRNTAEPLRRTTTVTRTISMLLLLGIVGFAAGIALLGWASAFGIGMVWQWGLTMTLAAEGTLIVALVWMAVRLWRNSRCVNRQLQTVGEQINQIEHATGTLAGSRLSSSQLYYDHFSRGMSPQMLVANLRGQVEQLARRM